MPVLIRGDRLLSPRMLGLDKVLRLKVFPIAISLPWGIAPAALPQFPLPAKIRTRLMPARLSSITIPISPTTTSTSSASTRRSRTRFRPGSTPSPARVSLPLFG